MNSVEGPASAKGRGPAKESCGFPRPQVQLSQGCARFHILGLAVSLAPSLYTSGQEGTMVGLPSMYSLVFPGVALSDLPGCMSQTLRLQVTL